LKVLDRLISESPRSIEFYELKALTFKSWDKPERAADTYKKLIQLEAKENTPPYYFELAMLAYKKNELQEAIRYFKRCILGKFNVGVSSFFIGMIELKNSNWGAASRFLNRVVKHDTEELKPAAFFYLAQVYFKTKQTARASDALLESITRSKVLLENQNLPAPTRKQIEDLKAAAENALAPLGKNQWFGNVSTILGYDSNFLSLPTESTTLSATDKASSKETLLVSVGWMSSPLKFLQWIPSYRANMNLNNNEKARSYESINQTLSLYINLNAIRPFSYGLKVDGNLSYQNLGLTTTRLKYERYSSDLDLGPYFKIELVPQWVLTAEFFAQTMDYKSDTGISTASQKGGWIYHPQFTLANENGGGFINPQATLSSKWSQSIGSQYQSRAYSLNLSNTFYWIKDLKSNASVGYSFLHYPKNLPNTRRDHNLSAYGSLVYSGTLLGLDGLSTSLDATYTKNISNLKSSYRYSKWTFNFGLSYSLF
jgi:tetratricopeptide (TPR) repeat protein